MPAIKAILWVSDLLKGLGYPQQYPLIVYSDSTNAVDNSKKPQLTSKLRHVDIKCQWILETILSGKVVVEHITTDEMLADCLTKPLPAPKHDGFVRTDARVGTIPTLVRKTGGTHRCTKSATTMTTRLISHYRSFLFLGFPSDCYCHYSSAVFRVSPGAC